LTAPSIGAKSTALYFNDNGTKPKETIMKRLYACALALFFAMGLAGCAGSMSQSDSGWVTLFDGSNLNSWDRIGDANWRLANGLVEADKGNGFLISKNSYTNFQIRAEFWVDDEANSGIFLRLADRTKVTATNSYEVNVFDKRPDPSYGTGAIVNVAKAETVLKAGGKWNTYEILANGDQFTITLNGVRTVNGVRDNKHASGPIALQYAGGVVKFRKVQIKPI
jgi:hypothetical protein